MTLRVLYGSSYRVSQTECPYLPQTTQFIALLPFVLKSRETAGRKEITAQRRGGWGKKKLDAITDRDVSL